MESNTETSSILEQLSQSDMEYELREATQTVYEAEMNSEPMQNGKQRNVDASKNTHFEFIFGEDESSEVYVYIERYSPEKGIEVMLWADKGWFGDDSGDYGTELSDGGETLEQFGDGILSLVADVIDADHTPDYEFLQNAGSSLVFSANFYL